MEISDSTEGEAVESELLSLEEPLPLFPLFKTFFCKDNIHR